MAMPTIPEQVAAIIKEFGASRLQEITMNQDNAEIQILSEWVDWRVENLVRDEQASGIDGVVFYDFLQKEKPHLLDFGRKGDKWQIIHAWLVREGAVVND